MDVPAVETFKQFAERNAASGTYPDTEWKVRGLHRNREAFGLKGAFVQIGTRWTVNRAKFYELLGRSGRAA